jgi:hypothetical protein
MPSCPSFSPPNRRGRRATKVTVRHCFGPGDPVAWHRRDRRRHSSSPAPPPRATPVPRSAVHPRARMRPRRTVLCGVRDARTGRGIRLYLRLRHARQISPDHRLGLDPEYVSAATVASGWSANVASLLQDFDPPALRFTDTLHGAGVFQNRWEPHARPTLASAGSTLPPFRRSPRSQRACVPGGRRRERSSSWASGSHNFNPRSGVRQGGDGPDFILAGAYLLRHLEVAVNPRFFLRTKSFAPLSGSPARR